MMAGNPNWWSMQSELRSTSDHNNHEQETNNNNNNNNSNNNDNNNNLFISQTHPSSNCEMLPIHHHQLHGSSSTSSSSSSLMPFISLVDHHHHHHHHDTQDFHHSWSQLLLGGMASEQEEERFSTTPTSHQFQPTRTLMNDIKSEVNSRSNNNNRNNNLYESQYHNHHNHEEQQQKESIGIISNNNNNNNNNRAPPPWTQLMPISSPKSCVTTLSSKITNNNINDDDNCDNIINNNNNNNNNNNMLDFTKNNKRSLQAEECHHQHAEHSTNSECNSPATGGVSKKPRIQPSSNPPLKVRKEKLGDRITSLHQLVSPFGKTDTASVLLEAIGYIRFLQGQIEALSSPYLGSNNASIKNGHSVQGERNCLFPDHPGQLLNDSCMKRRGAPNQEDKQATTKDLKSRGLCLVPISCTQLVGSDNGADYWAQSLGGGF